MALLANPDKVTPLVAKYAGIIGILGTVASAALQTSLLDSLVTKYDWVRVIIAVLTGLVWLAGATAGARAAKNKVTPVDNPMAEINGRLVELAPASPPRTPPSRGRFVDPDAT